MSSVHDRPGVRRFSASADPPPMRLPRKPPAAALEFRPHKVPQPGSQPPILSRARVGKEGPGQAAARELGAKAKDKRPKERNVA